METNGHGFSKAGLRRMREVLARYVDSGRIPGLVALVGRGGETHVEALGTMRAGGGAPMARDTVFRMASTSKPVGIAPAMVLLDECRLRLDDPVDEWLPELADRRVLERPDGPLDETVPARRPITVRDLMNSSFGLGLDQSALDTPIMKAIFESGIFTQGAGASLEPDEWMRRLGELPLSHQPGESWQYHIGNDVIGVLVARVTGRPYEAFLRERVLEPLGMEDTGFHVPADELHRLPVAYVPDPATGELNVWDEPETGGYASPPAFPSGGGLASTVDDYHAYFRMLLDGGRRGNERILSRPAVELMTTDHLTPAQRAVWFEKADHPVSMGLARHAGWGMGMAVRGYRSSYAPVGQFGWDGGTGTTVYADPKNDLVGIMLTQTGMSTPTSTQAIHDFWTTVYQAVED